ncbi:hypothetical protein P647_1580 [Acinetobacter baumannii UH12208]|nr:hypothetical protein P647_1580 [Acinetobacter baumannii UH12208]ETQ38338.1 hypothetical protein P656_2506 [Acinetobacter baumannii UH16208]ETQ55546.1 hypothetical protein P658_0724 [Acinetobacter baumannii UH19608]ETR06608.1 hypothetical protein P674_0996 [Acinetobacter baumannii UH6907]
MIFPPPIVSIIFKSTYPMFTKANSNLISHLNRPLAKVKTTSI